MGNPYFEFIRHDVTEPIYVEVDQIYNLACPASPIHYQYDPIKTGKTSVLGALHTLGLAKRVHARILQASTSEVYGDPEIHPQPESYRGCVNPIGIRSCYDEGKRMAETLFFDYHRQHQVDIKVIRIFNTYGPRMNTHDGRVVSNFIVQALKNENITIYGSGEQTRSFCYVDDLIEGMIRMMNSRDGFTGPVNIGNPGEFTMLELAQNFEAAPPAQQAAALKNTQSPVSCFTVWLSNVARMLCSLFVIEKLYLSGPAAASPAFMRGVVQKLKSPEMRPVVLNPDPVHTPAFMATDLRQSLLCSTDA